MIGIIPFLQANGLNYSIKGQRLTGQIKTYDPTIFCLQEINFKFKDTRGWNQKDGKRYTMQRETKSGQSSYINIRCIDLKQKIVTRNIIIE